MLTNPFFYKNGMIGNGCNLLEFATLFGNKTSLSYECLLIKGEHIMNKLYHNDREVVRRFPKINLY